MIPGAGVCVVRDTGKAIKGPARFDLFFHEREGGHRAAREWGRREIDVEVLP